MTDKKIYKRLPAILQTTAIKNFFESTVEQLYSKANVENIQGYVGAQRSEDVGATGSYLAEPTVTKRFYGLSPTINTLNPDTGDSENLIYYDELIDILKTYGVDVRNHNKIFSENYSTFLPPVDIDKFVNYSEYYWVPGGPSTIVVRGTLEQPIDVDRDVLGQSQFTPPSGVPFRNGMIVEFGGDFVIPSTRLGVEYIVEGVGESIFFVPKADNFSTRFSTPGEDQYDPGLDDINESVAQVHSEADYLSNVKILNGGVGYVEPKLFVYDNPTISVLDNTDTPIAALTPYITDDSANSLVDLRIVDPSTGSRDANLISLASIVEYETEQNNLTEYAVVKALYDNADLRTGALAEFDISLNSNRIITDINITNNNQSDPLHRYSGQVRYALYDKLVEHEVNLSLTANLVTGNSSQQVFQTTEFVLDSLTDIKVGQAVSGLFTGIVKSITPAQSKIELENAVPVTVDMFSAGFTVRFQGRGFSAELLFDDVHTVVENPADPDNTVVTILESQRKSGVNPNNFNDYYVINALPGFDEPGGPPWSGTDTQEVPDYLLQARGATNRNVWSRVNFWYHRQNFVDAGDKLPIVSLRAQRPIVEFDRNLELYNHGVNSLGFVNTASIELTLDDINGRPSGFLIDGVPTENSSFIFLDGDTDVIKHVYTTTTVQDEVQVTISDPSNANANAIVNAIIGNVTLGGFAELGYVDSIEVTDGGANYTGNVEVVISHSAGRDANATAVVDGSGTITDILLFDRTPTAVTYDGEYVKVLFNAAHNLSDGDVVNIIGADPSEYNGTYEIIATSLTEFLYVPNVRPSTNSANTVPTVKTGGRNFYEVGLVRVTRLPNPDLNPDGRQDGDDGFVPIEAQVNDIVQVVGGNQTLGREYIFRGTEWIIAQEKLTVNQAPLFNLYDTDGRYLGDQGVYPNNNFAGNPIFGYATQSPADDVSSILGTNPDSVLGFPLVFKQFKATSEIVFENYLDTATYSYRPLGAPGDLSTVGYLYYKLLKTPVEYHSAWKVVDDRSRQRIHTLYNITQIEVDQQRVTYFVGCTPELDSSTPSGYDIRVRVNGEVRTDYTYGTSQSGYIDFAEFDLSAGDLIEIDAYGDDGLFDINSVSKYELPLGWSRNPNNEDVEYTSEPEYLEHFRRYLENQSEFEGDVFANNNSSSIALDPRHATEIVNTTQDLMLGAFLVDDQPHNLLDALRFNAQEYIKYRNRVRAEIDRYNQSNNIDALPADVVLEQVLRNVISYKVGMEVFNRTYVMPFGDNFEQQTFTVAVGQTEFVLDSVLDFNQLENTLLVFHNDELLRIDNCYVLSDHTPITVTVQGCVNLQAGDTITTRIYTSERDSAQCPPTPSTMGLFPLYVPQIVIDDSYQTPIEVILGHDGSRTPTVGDQRDQVLLDFEKRIYNAAKKEFRETNSLPEYNIASVRAGAFRNTGYPYTEWYDLMRSSFSRWTADHTVDAVSNEYFDIDNEWTWQYGTEELPGHWRGIYEYYYDTVRPHTHPWEMLGFTEKPLWWDSQYIQQVPNAEGELVPVLSYAADNVEMWSDLEQGIIRQGPRENFTDGRYLLENPYRRLGLSEIIPVDMEGELITPFRLFSTGTTQILEEWQNTQTGNNDPDYAFRTSSFLQVDTLNVSYDESGGISGSGNIYVSTTENSLSIPRKDLNMLARNESPMPDDKIVAVLVNGTPVYGIKSPESWNNGGEWHYNLGYDHIEQDQLRVITPQMLGVSSWKDYVDQRGHSKLVGWALDGLPIYGPYGYRDTDTSDFDSEIVKIRSPWVLRTDSNRQTAPGGAHTGVFVEDFRYDASLSVNQGYTDRFNHRNSITPDSPNASTKLPHYVITVDDNDVPAFPYHIGGGRVNTDQWANRYFSTAPLTGRIADILVREQGALYVAANTTITITGNSNSDATANAVIEDGRIVDVIVTDPGSGYSEAQAVVVDSTGSGVRAELEVVVSTSDNSTGNSYVNPDATPSIVSVLNTQLVRDSDLVDDIWKFGDGAPVENAWKSTELYPFAVAEALLLAKPGRFARVFSEPSKLYRPDIDKRLLLNRDTNRRWQLLDAEQFPVHGDIDQEGNFVTSIGYTQFVNSWLKFQGLDTDVDFVPKLRTLNMKLSHRMSGYVDKDTMTVRTDQYSNDGNATSLIIPQENIAVGVHSSPNKTRNYYSGVQIEKTATGYRVRGYDRNLSYFSILESNTLGPRERVTVGGEPAAYVEWQPNQTYRKDTIVQRLGNFYQANLTVSTGTDFDKSLWTRLPSLPQIGGATSTLYQKTTGRILRVNYETEFATVDQVYDFLISLGRHQERAGYDFGEYDEAIADVRDWIYAAKQFLFWTTGRWEIGNTVELSPLAPRVRFSVPTGFISKLNRSDREQFSIVNAAGAVIDPTQCEIVREDNRIEIAPPQGEQIYGVLLYTKEIEHALTIDNLTEFADVIYNPVINQKHSRVKVTGTRTANWTGKFLTEGFIIEGDELKPNLDNLAESLGRYHELGFIPVEKQVYEQARALFGYTEREYLTELDIIDDQQFDFYRGMIQSKGTNTSLTRIGRSRTVAEGNINVFSEWALRVADFGDTESDQSLELQVNKSDIVQNPQLITLALPEDVTNRVARIDVLEAKFVYTSTPEIELPAPADLTGTQATAIATLDTNGKLSLITVTEPGSGYGASIGADVIAANVLVDSESTRFVEAVATPLANNIIDFEQAEIVFNVRDNISNANANVNIAANGNVVIEDVLSAINDNANVNSHLRIEAFSNLDNGNVAYSVRLSGSDFTVIDGANIGVTNGSYQPVQKYAIDTATNSDAEIDINDVTVLVDGQLVPSTAGNVTNWAFSPSNTTTVSSDGVYPATVDGNTTVSFALGTTISNIETDAQGRYKYLELYINGVRVTNMRNGLGNDANTGLPLFSGTVYEIVGNDTLRFPDISLIPRDALVELYDPPLGQVINYNEQRELYYGFDSDTEFRLVEKATVEFDNSYQGDLPGKTLNIRVTSKDRIAVRTETVRSFEITLDAQDDDVLFIDIDNVDKFLKRPSDVADKGLWPTTAQVDATGVTDSRYPTVRNAGYVNPANVNFRAYDVGSLPDLFSDDMIIKPDSGDLVHIAVSENRDWNVYRLQRVNTNESFVFRNDDGVVNLYTDVSLFNFLDSNQIGAENTGRFLDYVLTVKNANISDNVIVWRNEDIVQSTQSDLRDFEAPRMIEARIASIGPVNLTAIANIEPVAGRTLQNLALTPLNDNSSTVLVTSPDLGTLRSGDVIQLIDNVGISYVVDAEDNRDAANNTITLSAQTVDGITVIDGGDGYTFVPNVTVDTGTATGNTQAVAFVSGTITSIDVRSSSDYSVAEAWITEPGSNANIDIDIVDGTVTSIVLEDGGTGYDVNSLPSVAIDAPVSGITATAEVTADDVDETTGEILRIRVTNPGSDYTVSDRPNVTITAAQGNGAVALAEVRGQVSITVNNGGEGYYVDQSDVVIRGDGTFADGHLNITGSVDQIYLQDSAVGYTTIPTVTIEAPDSGNTATANASMDSGLTRIQEAANLSIDGNVYVSLTGDVSFVTAGDSNADLTERDFDNVRQSRLILADSYLVENLNVSTGTFEIASDLFGDTQSLGNFAVLANATTADSSITISGTPGLVDGDVVYYDSNALGTVNTVVVGDANTTINFDATLTANVSMNDTVEIQGDSVWQEGVIDLTGYSVRIRRRFEPLASNVPYHIISNVSNNSFTIQSANISQSVNAIGIHLNKTQMNLNTNPFEVGDVVRINSNTVNGRYRIENSIGNSVVIDAPFELDFTQGNIVSRGVEIRTTNAHTITPVYAANKKRVAVHFTEPLYYNKVYPISTVTPESLIVDGFWPQDDITHVFYEERYGTVSAQTLFFESGDANSALSASANVATNVIEVTRNARLNEVVAQYNSNSAIVPSNQVTVFDVYSSANGTLLSAQELELERAAGNTVNYVNTVAVVDPGALPSNTAVSTDITITRQILRNDNRYPVVTTLDHKRAYINGSVIDIDSYNNPEAVAASINRNIGIRRSMIENRNTGFGMRFLMLNDPKTPVLGDRSAGAINNYGPYVKDQDLIRRLSGGTASVTEELQLTDPTETQLDRTFNRGSILIGPHQGLFYYDFETGVQYAWNPVIGEYRPVRLTPEQSSQLDILYRDTASVKAPEFHRNSTQSTRQITEWRATSQQEKEQRDQVLNDNGDPVGAVVYVEDTVVSRGSRYYVANADVNYSDNVTFNTDIWREVESGTELARLTSTSNLILDRVPGTGGNSYTMTATVGYTVDSETRVMWKYRLRHNNQNAFQVYQAVQHATDDEPYYILIDKSSPLVVPHDFYGTINAHNDFGVYSDVADPSSALGGVYTTTDYYYDNEHIITFNNNDQITNTDDPVIRKRNSAYVLNISAVEPATVTNGQLIPEPFAAQSGNGTNASENFLSLPRLSIVSPDAGIPIEQMDTSRPLGTAHINVEEPGYNRFLMWTPGLTPGKWSPTFQGPGSLPGANNKNVGIGYGRGYYAAGDDHLSGEYPEIPYGGYNQPLPRFLYTRKYSVSPMVRNYTAGVYTDINGNELTEQQVLDLLAAGQQVSYAEITPDLSAQGSTDINSTKVRPEEIFVACFWIESHRYKNQLVAWDYRTLNAAGLPKPIYSDYDGTVTRVKYIRLTELPNNAVTRRPIPDTGWAGNDWNNKRTDSVFFNTDNREDRIWDMFRPSDKQAGSTGDIRENEPTLSVDTSITPRFR